MDEAERERLRKEMGARAAASVKRRKPLPKTRQPRRHLEHEAQAALFEWAIVAALRLPELRLLHAVPNWAGVKGPKEGAMRKREGVKAGVPDIHLPVARGGYIGLWVEMKAPPEGTKKRQPTPEQKQWIAALRAAGHRVVVCWSTHAARHEIEAYLAMAPTRTEEASNETD